MRKCYLILIVSLLPSLAAADWLFQQSEDGNWISTQNSQHHRFIVSGNHQQKRFLLVLSLRSDAAADPLHPFRKQPPDKQAPVESPASTIVNIDQDTVGDFSVRRLKQTATELSLQVDVNQEGQQRLIKQLVAGLTLQFSFANQQPISFSLAGFTSALNDFYIASEIGRLDPYWLQLHGKINEQVCYEISLAMVQAMRYRQQGRTRSQVSNALSGKMSDEAENTLPDVIDQVYGIPVDRLPKIPSTEKYSIFKKCMRQMQEPQ